MSDDDENEADKTQIFLPGGTPLTPPGAGKKEEDAGVLLKPESKAAGSDTVVDFDITAGETAEIDHTATTQVSQPATPPPPPVAASSSSSSAGTVITIIILGAIAALGYFLLR